MLAHFVTVSYFSVSSFFSCVRCLFVWISNISTNYCFFFSWMRWRRCECSPLLSRLFLLCLAHWQCVYACIYTFMLCWGLFAFNHFMLRYTINTTQHCSKFYKIFLFVHVLFAKYFYMWTAKVTEKKLPPDYN